MAVEKERAALQSKENLNPKEELQNLMNQLKELTESGEGRKKLSKKLNEGVSLFLKNHQDVVGTVKQIYEGLDSDSKEGLQSLMKLAKVDEEVRDEQREINVRLEALREQQALSEEIRGDADKLQDAIKFQLTSKINELYSEGDYQGALDNAVYLLSAKDKATAFSLIKAILKATPTGETLYIKDKKISSSKRREWIQKMDDNMEAAIREFQKSYYPEASITDDFTLTEVTDKHSDKKAAKELDKELSGNKDLYKITKRINVPSAGALIEANLDAIRKVFDDAKKEHPNDSKAVEAEVKKNLDKAFFFNHEYLPQDGKKLTKADELKNKEWEALVNLCTYRMWTELEEPTEGKTSAKASYDALILSQVSGVGTSELEQARGVLKQVDVDKFKVPEGASEAEKKQAKQKAKETLMTLLGDLNWDGRITNTSTREGVDRKGLDKGTLFGGQVLNMFDTAVKRFGEEKVITNIEAVIQGLNGLKGFKVEPKTIEGLIAAFKNNPSALIAFRNKLMNEPDAGNGMFNAGTEYVTRRLESYEREVNFRKSLDNFFDNTEEGKEILNEMEKELDKVMEEELEKKTLPRLKEYAKTEDFSKLTDGQKEQINKVIEQLSTEAGRKEFLSSGNQSKKDMYKNFVISGIGLSYTDVSVDGQHTRGGGIGGSVMNEKLNAWLKDNTKNIISKASASVGMYCADGNVSVGVGLGFGSSTNLNENTKVYYNVNAISWSPFNPKGLAFGAVVGTETRVNPSADNSLDLKSAKYIGVAGAYGFGLDLSNPDFNAHSVSLSGYWRRDKLEGVERKAEKVREKMAPIFNHLFEIKGDVTVQTIIENLRGGKMNDGKEFSGFANTSGETLYKTAVAIFNMYNSYKGKLGESANKEQIIQKISENFADNLYREMRNKDIEKIVNEGLHLSGVNVGVSWSFARLFTGFFLSGGLTFTYYENSEYEENPIALEKAQKGMENPDNYDIITNESKTYKEKMDTINDILGDKYLAYHPEVIIKTLPELGGGRKPAHISLSKEAFGKDIKIMCSPDLAPYIIQENGEIKLPGNADISLAQIRHQGKVESTLILGAKSTTGCEAITLDGDKLKWKGNSTVEFGSKKDDFEKYNTEIKTKIEVMNVGLDGKPNKDLKDYLEGNGDALVNFRLGNANYKKFIAAIKSDSTRGDGFVENTIQYLPDELKKLVTSGSDEDSRKQAVDDIRFIYASLSRVSQTRDKQLERDNLADKANEYLNDLGIQLSSTNRLHIEKCINIAAGGGVLGEEDWKKMKGILGINYNNWEYKAAISNTEKLFHILTPVKKLAEKRKNAYERKIGNEYKELPEGSSVLLAARNESLKKLNDKMTAKGELKMEWIGAVAGYDGVGDTINDKFVSSPKIISGSEVPIQDSDIVKRHFLTELSSDDVAQFNAIKEKIISTLKKSIKKEDKDLAQAWEEMNNSDFIDAILSKKTKNEKGEDVLKVSFNMQYGFFADCVNETILLGDINVITTTEEQIQAPHDVRYYDATVTNDAVTIGHSFSVGATFGKIKTKQPDAPEPPEKPDEPVEPEEPKEPTEPVAPEQGKTEPIVDVDGLQGATEVDFDKQTFKYEGVTYTYVVDEIDGKQTMVAWTPDNKFYVVTKGPDGNPVFTPVDTFSWSSILGNAAEVDFNRQQYEDLMKQYEEAKKQYNIDKEKYKVDLENYKKAKAQYDVDLGRYNELKGKYDVDLKEYEAKYKSFIDGLPVAKRAVAWNIVRMNYQILTAEPSTRAEYIKQVKKYKSKLLIDRIVG